MIVICVIVAVIGSLICALLKAKIDDWLGDSSMKGQSRLSLRKSHSNELQATCSDIVEISDDESIDLSPNIRKSTKERTKVTSHGTIVINSVAGVSKNFKHDISNDLSSDDEVAVIDNVSHENTFNKSQSMFSWNKSTFVTNPLHRHIFPESSFSLDSRDMIPLVESPCKRQKVIHSSDDESVDFLNEEDLSPMVEIQHELMIAGTKVKLPVKPYSCQKAVMNSLIQGCTKEQNCLLESPTGSGKTLALLCGALAWQEQFREKIGREGNDGTDAESYDNDDSINNFFLNSMRYFDEELSAEQDKASASGGKSKPQKVPKIYYGTRTHKQIEQVIREFRKTAYRYKRMTILSSRRHTCIQESDKNKDKLCNELLDPLKTEKCHYYYNEHAKKTLAIFGDMNTPWDIEDLVSTGKKIGRCPYFAARYLMAEAEIIFCPYNYILNPSIRDSVNINLKGNIVILDEAHNVEDICRSAASVDLRDDSIAAAAKECNYLVHKGRNSAMYAMMHAYLKDFEQFIKNVEVKDNDSRDEMNSNHWLGIELRALLDVNNVGCTRFTDFRSGSIVAIEDFKKNMKEENAEKRIHTITQETMKILEYLCFAMQMIESDVRVNDYKMCIVETTECTAKTAATQNTWISTTTKMFVSVRTMKLLCMNPAIVFKSVSQDARSVILASGTLTPITTFQSELGTQFAYIVNPGHIISKDQVYVRYLKQGPNGIPLTAKYNTVNTWEFQDELGNLTLQVCDSVPYGVLCFFASYNVMSTVHKRWKSNGTWDKLSKLKRIFVEPKDNKDLPAVMREYRSVIEESSSKSFRTACGAILFAIFRAKVAEGIDFSDNEARCVIAVGIPYLFKSDDIGMKMKYNDSENESNKSRELLSGSEWYTVNAFRALNQAIGRCVRHIDDWGAVLLVDKRFQESRNINYLPKWIKTSMRYDDNYDLEIELQDFVVMQIARERGKKMVEN